MTNPICFRGLDAAFLPCGASNDFIFFVLSLFAGTNDIYSRGFGLKQVKDIFS